MKPHCIYSATKLIRILSLGELFIVFFSLPISKAFILY